MTANFTTPPIIPYHKASPHFTEMTIGLIIMYSVVAFTAVVSNILILVAIIKRVVPRNTVNVFLSSLAVSDLIMVLLSLFDCVAFVYGSWVFGEAWCKIQSYLLEVSFSASTFTLVAVSCERYLLICFPHRKRRTIKSIYKMVLLVWFVSLCVCSPLLDGYLIYDELNKTNTVEIICSNKGWSPQIQQLFYGIYSIMVYLVPLFIMAFAHWRISCSVKEKGTKNQSQASRKLIANNKPEKKNSICFTIKEESASESSSTENKITAVQRSLMQSFSSLKRKANALERERARDNKRMKAIRLLFVVTVTFFVLWTPFTILRVVSLSGITVNGYLYKFSEVLIFSSTAVNGFIYAFMSLPFRNSFKSLILCQVTREALSRDSGPSYSNSDDNRLHSKKTSHASNYSGYHSSSDADCKNTISIGDLANNKTEYTNGKSEYSNGKMAL